MSDRKPYKFVTPRLVLIYPKLTKPDTKYKAEGEYRAKGKCALADYDEAVITALTEARDAFFEETKAELEAKRAAAEKAKKGADAKKLAQALAEIKVRDLFAPDLDRVTGEETGLVVISTKMVASGKSKKDGKPWTRAPKLFDAGGPGREPKRLPANVQIWGGSEAKLAVEALPYYTPKDNEVGIAFYLNAAQVLKLVKGGGEAAADHGFGGEEGYSSEDAPAGDADGSENPGEGMPDKAPGAGDDF